MDDDMESVDDVSDARITAQLSHMGERLEKTHAMLSELQVVLEPILLPEKSRGGVVDGPASLPSSQLSHLIDTYNGSIGDLQDRIRYITKRVQL